MARQTRRYDVDPLSFSNSLKVTFPGGVPLAEKSYGRPFGQGMDANQVLTGLRLGGNVLEGRGINNLYVPFSGIITSRNRELAVKKAAVLNNMQTSESYRRALGDLDDRFFNQFPRHEVRLDTLKVVPFDDIEALQATLGKLIGIYLNEIALGATAHARYENALLFKLPVPISEKNLQADHFLPAVADFFKKAEPFFSQYC